MTTGAGLLVGVLRWVAKYPHHEVELFQELQTAHVDYKVAPWTYIISAVSLCGGANLGPEQAMVRGVEKLQDTNHGGERERETHTQRERERQRDRDREKETERQRDRQRERERGFDARKT